MTTTQEFINFYDILPGVNETSDAAAIRKEIRDQRQIWNKRAAQADPVKREQAQKRIRDLAEAERVLLDADRKRTFDQQARHQRSTTTAGAAGPSDGRDWLSQARAYFDGGNAASAYYASREAIAQNGSSHEAWSIRANSSFLMNNFQDAGFEFREAIRLKPDSPDYHFDYAEAFAARDQWSDARSEYEAALRLDPSNPLYRTAIANVLLHQDEPQRALDIMEEVVKENPQITVFQYYLALAIEQVQLTKWSQTRSGSYILTSPAQIELTRKMSGRALALKFDDEPLRRSLKENLQLAERAAATKWYHSNILGWLIALVIGLVLISVHGIGLILVIAVVALYTVTHRRPVWKQNAKSPAIVKRGI